MNNLRPLALSGLLASVPHAEEWDTGLLKEGNTWLYEHTSQRYIHHGTWQKFDGTVRFTITSVSAVPGAINFTVAQETDDFYEGPRNYSFHLAGEESAFSPQVPIFMEGQRFTDTSARALYRGDTVRTRTDSFARCNASLPLNINVETVGRVSHGWGGCYGMLEVSTYRLLAFNGEPYSLDSTAPVSLAGALRAPARSQGTRSALHGNNILIEHAGFRYDLKGQKVRAPAR
jgi:hypothetical protein